MSAVYHVIEYGHRSTFLNPQAREGDALHLLSLAARATRDNGGNLTAALAGLQNSNKFYKQLSYQDYPLRLLNAEGAEEYDQDFQAGQGVDQRVTIDLDRGVLAVEHDGQQPIPEEILGLLKQAREAPAIRLRDLLQLGLPPTDVYLVHRQSDVGTIPASGLRELTGKGRAEFADLLSAKVEAIQSGAYGVELVMTGILPERLADFDRAQAAMLRAGPYQGLFQAEGRSQAPACPEEALQAVRDYLRFERDTAQIWPWFLSADEMLSDGRKLREIGAALHQGPENNYDTEDIHQALTEAFGENPTMEQDLGQTMAP